MIEVRGFNGKLNFDDNLYRVPNGDYVDALNITRDAQGQGLDEAVSDIVGNQVITDSLPSGTNKIIGTRSDSIRNRVYFFTWNSDGYNRISYYDQVTESIVLLIEDLTDSNNVGILNFDPSYRINHIDIIYRDEEGDLLFWTDGLNPPSKINVQTIIDGTLLPLQRSYIDVAKEPPSAPPYCIYDNDLNVTVNNLNKKQFKFKYRFVYDDLEKSVTSAQSELVIPVNYTNDNINANPNYNNNIVIALQSGAENVTKIEIFGSESLGTTWSDFYLIEVINKDEQGLNSNDVFVYKFYNDKAYNTIDIKESIQPFDNVPQIAYTQSLPNGNVLDYGAITEGYDLIELNATATSGYLENYNYSGSILFLAYQNAQPAFGDGDIKIICYGQNGVDGSVSINIDDNGTLLTFTTTSISNYATIVFDIYTQALAAGFTIVYVDFTNLHTLIINKSGASLVLTINNAASIPYTVVSFPFFIVNSALNNNSQLAYNWSSQYGFGIVYFDEKGRTNGVVYNQNTMITTDHYYDNTYPILYSTNIVYNASQPEIILTINSRPPIWASYYEVVRTKCLNKSNFLYWISENTFKDYSANVDGYKYAYISLANLTAYVAANKGKKNLGYEFTPGDRIRFIKLYDASGNTFDQLYPGPPPILYKGNYTDKDYEIVETLSQASINGVEVNGLIIKIVLPTTDFGFDFGGNTYSNYLVEIYSPSKNFSDELNLYYEFGEKYIIGNAGTTSAYHEGLSQNQSSDLVTPAIITSYKGDNYFRSRLIPTSGSVKWQFATKSNIINDYYPMVASISYNSTHNNAYTPNNTTTSNGNFLTINTPTAPPAFYISGQIVFTSSVATPTAPYLEFYDGTNTQFWFNLPLVQANVQTTFQIPNSSIQTFIPYGWTTWGIRLRNFQGTLVSFDLTLTDGKNIYQPIIDANFSDDYESSASPNGRAWKFDPNAEQSFNPTLIRYGGEFQAGTTVNDINRFYEESFDVYDRSRGSIKKMFIEGRNQYIFQEFDVGVVTVLTQIVRDTAGNPLSAQSDKLLNKIVYPYIGGYGIGNIPESFAYGKHAKYFIDNNKGVVCRLSTDGITPLSIMYKTNAFFVPFLSKYNDTYNTVIPTTGTPTVYGAYDAYTNKYIICMDEIDREDYSQPAFTLSFLESRDSKQGFESFLSYHPENICALNNLLISCKDGLIWTHNNEIYCNFYGVQYDATITPVFNDQPLVKKTFISLMETANNIWYCPSMVSQATSYGSTNQESSIVSARFQYLEGQYHAAILRDANSQGGIINGDIMKGNYLKVKLQLVNPAAFYYLNTVSLKYIESPLNVR